MEFSNLNTVPAPYRVTDATSAGIFQVDAVAMQFGKGLCQSMDDDMKKMQSQKKFKANIENE